MLPQGDALVGWAGERGAGGRAAWERRWLSAGERWGSSRQGWWQRGGAERFGERVHALAPPLHALCGQLPVAKVAR